MRLTLYSNCRLTKEYNEVIQSSYLNDYLNSLTKVIYEDIGEVYLTRQGTFNVSMLSNGIFQYNYFKLEDEVNSITRYFFIDDINIINGTCVIDYSEDIWSSYSSYINIIKGNVSNLRYGLGSNLKFLPVEYASNDALDVVQAYSDSSYGTNSVEAIVNISFYNFDAQGEPTTRFYKTFVARVQRPQPLAMTRIPLNISLLKGLISGSSGLEGFTWQIDSNTSLNFDAYDVVSSYLIPKDFTSNVGIDDALPSYYSKINCYVDAIAYGSTTEVRLYEIPTALYTKSNTLTNDYKLYAIGMLDNNISITPNGSDIKWSIKAYITEMYVNFILQVETSIIDLTSSFNIELPISVQTADVTQQQAISRSVQNQVNAIDRQQLEVHRWTKMASRITTLTGNAISSASGSTDMATSLSISAREVIGSFNDVTDYMANVKRNELDKWQTNYEMFTTNTAISISNDKLYSIYNSLVILKVVPDNDAYVDAIIDVTGYNTNIVISDNTLLTTAQESKTYNIIKFSSVMLYGNIPHSIQADLSSILTKGVKIYFTSSI